MSKSVKRPASPALEPKRCRTCFAVLDLVGGIEVCLDCKEQYVRINYVEQAGTGRSSLNGAVDVEIFAKYTSTVACAARMWCAAGVLWSRTRVILITTRGVSCVTIVLDSLYHKRPVWTIKSHEG